MRQFAVVILLTFYSSGVIFSPQGNFSCTKYVPEMYARCIAEDTEIEVTDFVFEHLLNLESLIEFFEQEEDDTDPPGAPYQLPQTAIQANVTVPQTFKLELKQYPVKYTETIYGLYKNSLIPVLFTNDIFRPPTS